MTAGDKTAITSHRNISEVVFLKRRFVWDEELSCYIPPLDRKSMARMLIMKKDSILTAKDHGATVLSEYLREAVYHGKEFYEQSLAMALELIKDQQLEGNGYLDIRSFDDWRSLMKEGNFQTFTTRPFAIPDEVKLEGYTTQ